MWAPSIFRLYYLRRETQCRNTGEVGEGGENRKDEEKLRHLQKNRAVPRVENILYKKKKLHIAEGNNTHPKTHIWVGFIVLFIFSLS